MEAVGFLFLLSDQVAALHLDLSFTIQLYSASLPGGKTDGGWSEGVTEETKGQKKEGDVFSIP